MKKLMMTLFAALVGAFALPAGAGMAPDELTITGTTAEDKTYDGTTAATVQLGTVSGICVGEDISVSASGVFDSKDVGNGKTVTITYTLSGADATHYVVTPSMTTTTTADIEPRDLTVSDTVAEFDYNGSATGELAAPGMLTGVIAGDDVTLLATATSQSGAEPGAHDMNVTYTLSGSDAGNYVAPASAAMAGSIRSVAGTVTVTDVADVTFVAYTNEVGAATQLPGSSPYTVASGADVLVVYTAAAGKMFPGGYRTFTTNVTASAEETTVTLAADQQPVVAKACTDCITFSADADFGIRLVKNNMPPTVNLEYSTDQTYWETFNVDTDYAAGAEHKLYLRGTGNTAFAANIVKYYAFTNTSDSVATAIACSGNIETLLDYRTVEKGNHPEMGQYAFVKLFCGFASLTAAPELPAKSLAPYCYCFLFRDCTSLTAAPELPAMTLVDSCYRSMFYGCTSLTAAPELPATTLAPSCYGYLFSGCTSLTAAPELPATNLQSGCYGYLFRGCTSLTAAPELPATNLAESCYGSMFSGCTSLTAVPELPATNLQSGCYGSMFSGCSSLTAAPELPATNLATRCYNGMFSGCASLTAAPELPATTLAPSCYGLMFSGCTSLTAAPELPATTLATSCYYRMFYGCTSLIVNTNTPGKAWSLPAEAVTAVDWSAYMFADTPGDITNTTVTCGTTYYIASAPAAVTVTDVAGATAAAYTNEVSAATQLPGSSPYTVQWGGNVYVVYTVDADYMFEGGYRTFTTNVTASAEATTVTLAADQLPVEAKACTDCLTFSADADFGIRLVKKNTPPMVNLEYSRDQTNWEAFNVDTDYTAGADHKLYLRGTANTRFASNPSRSYAFTNTTDSVATAIACSGNIETLLDYRTVASGNHPEMATYAFCGLFRGFASLTAAPELPATNLSELCYNSMFNGCTSLTAAPELPATNLAASCYVSMFNGCTSLTAVPELPALNLQDGCYSGMFFGCTSLTAVPELPAKKLATFCYSSMFGGCTSLTAAPEMPATTLAEYCYFCMFGGCTSLIVNTNAPGKAWSIPAEAATATGWSIDMFVDTPGDITNTTVTCGRAYYIASAPATIDVTKPEHATYQAFTNGESVAEVPFTVNYITPVTVTYEADDGYAFANGSKTFTTNVTASAAVTTVTLAADQLPGTPKVQLGVVAQRYPWNGILDVNYRTLYTPAGMYRLRLKVEVEGDAKGQVYFEPEGVESGIGSVAFDLREAFGEVKGKAKVTTTLEKMEK